MRPFGKTGSHFTITGGGNYTETGGFTTMEGGTLVATTGSIFINGGNLQGIGTLGTTVTIGGAGILGLGQVSDTLAIDGGLVLNGFLSVNIAGNQVGSASGYEQLDIRGDFENDGWVTTAPVNGGHWTRRACRRHWHRLFSTRLSGEPVGHRLGQQPK